MIRKLFFSFSISAGIILMSGSPSYSFFKKPVEKTRCSNTNDEQPATGTSWDTGKPKKSQSKKQPGRRVGWNSKQKSSRAASSKSSAAYRRSGPSRNAGAFSYSNASIKSKGNWRKTRVIASSKGPVGKTKKNWKSSNPSTVKNIKNTQKAH